MFPETPAQPRLIVYNASRDVTGDDMFVPALPISPCIPVSPVAVPVTLIDPVSVPVIPPPPELRRSKRRAALVQIPEITFGPEIPSSLPRTQTRKPMVYR